MSERKLKRIILEAEDAYEEQAKGDGPEADTAAALLAWARGEEIDPEHAQRILDRAEAGS